MSIVVCCAYGPVDFLLYGRCQVTIFSNDGVRQRHFTICDKGEERGTSTLSTLMEGLRAIKKYEEEGKLFTLNVYEEIYFKENYSIRCNVVSSTQMRFSIGISRMLESNYNNNLSEFSDED